MRPGCRIPRATFGDVSARCCACACIRSRSTRPDFNDRGGPLKLFEIDIPLENALLSFPT